MDPLMHTLSSEKYTTTSWGWSKAGKVAITVCYLRFQRIRAEVLGSLGEINENKVVTETFYIYAAFLKEPSVGVKLFGKVSDSFSNFDGYSASKRLPTAQNFPMTIPVTRPTNSQTSNMNIKFIASPPYFYGERSAMSMPNHREGSKEKERSNGATTKRS